MRFSEYNSIFKADNSVEEYILFNSFNGSMFKIDSETKEKIETNNILALSDKTLNEYKLAAIILEDNIDERKILDYFHKKTKFDNEVLSITLLLTQASNNDMYWNNIYVFLTKQAEADKVKKIHIVLFGGETLLGLEKNKKWLNKIKGFCDQTNKSFSTSVITNQILITDEILGLLLSYNCNMIQITLDEIKEIHDMSIADRLDHLCGVWSYSLQLIGVVNL